VLAVATTGAAPPGPVDVLLPPDFGAEELVAALEDHAVPLGAEDRPTTAPASPTPRFRGRLVAVCGPGGTGASVVAMALAQHGGADPRRRGMVALADLARTADQALLHDAGDVAPGVPELVEAHRGGDPDPEQIRRLLHTLPDRGYELLLGLRRHRDWTALRPRAVGAALDGLLGAYGLVVADCDADVEGELETGSVDVEERNALTRAAVARADLVVVVGTGGTKGTHAHARTCAQLLDHGVPPGRLVPLVNHAGRTPGARAAAARALGDLLDAAVAGPVFAPTSPRVEPALRDGHPLPDAVAAKVGAPVLALLGRLPTREAADDGPVPVLAGRLGTGAGV
jgi:hypothetical protein